MTGRSLPGLRLLAGLAGLVGLVLLATLTAVPPPAAARAPEADCYAGGVRQTLNGKQPVLLVHGFFSDPDKGWDWSEGGLPDQLGDAGAFVEPFDYRSAAQDWVTHPDIGRPLADKIARLSDTSRCDGGDGKVVVVAHSMGGLATRCALAAECGGRDDMVDRVGLVVTLGTPSLGTHLRGEQPLSTVEDLYGNVALLNLCTTQAVLRYAGANFSNDLTDTCDLLDALANSAASHAFLPGSAELLALPPYPAGVSVRALAGRMLPRLPVLNWQIAKDIGDGPVSVPSALADATTDEHGGQQVYECGGDGAPPVRDCFHTNLTKSEMFVRDVVTTVTGYMERRAQEAAKAAAEAAAEAAAAAERRAEEVSARGRLPAPQGPVLKIDSESEDYPFAIQGIAAGEFPTVGGYPAPAGMKYVVIAVQVRGLLDDRAIRPPESVWWEARWPEEDCRTLWGDTDRYLCNRVDLDYFTKFLPPDATALHNVPGSITEDGVIAPGERYDVLLRTRVPEEVDLAQMRLLWGIRDLRAEDLRPYLPLEGLPALQ